MILAVKLDGSYRWQCDDCGAERNEYPHRGPRNSLCKRCQNIRYRAGRRDATGPTGSAAGKAAGGRNEANAGILGSSQALLAGASMLESHHCELQACSSLVR